MIELSGLASLMIFFLALFIAAAFSYRDLPRYNADLAPTDHPKAMPGVLKEDALRVSVTRNGTIVLTESSVSMGDLAPLLQLGVRRGSERKVYLRADAWAKYGDVKAVLDQIRLAGIENAALITAEAPHKPAP